MPELYFTPHQESTWLTQNGYSPDAYYIDAASGSVLPKVKKPSTINTDLNINQLPVNKSNEQEGPSVFGSFTRGAATGVGPNIGALATGGRVASALMPLATELAPSTRGLSYGIPAAGGILSGLLTSLGLNKIQDAILPKSIKDTLQKDVETNPGSFLSGQIVSQLPVLKPSVGNLIRGAKTAGQIGENLITGGARPVAGADVSNLINVGLGAGTGLGAATIPNLIQGREINPLEVALSTAGGALFSEPTKLGQKLGKLTPTTKREDIEAEARRIQGEDKNETLYERADRMRQAQVKAGFLEQEPKGLRASLIRAETGTPADKLPQKQFDISETDVRPRTFYSESKTNDKGEAKYLIPFNKISKEDKSLFPSLVNEKGSLRTGVDEATFREKLDERLYGDEFREYKNILAEAQETKKQVDIREQQERTAELASREQKVLQNITQSSVEQRGKNTNIKPVEPLGAEEAKKQGTEFGERKFTTSQLAEKPVATLRQKSFNKELNYKLWKDAWFKASVEGDDVARKEAERLLEPGFADRYVSEEIHGKKTIPFNEQENLPKQLLKKPTKFQEEQQGLQDKENVERLSSAKKIESKVPLEKLSLKAKTFDYMKKVFGPLRNVDIKEDADIATKGVAVLREGVNKTVAKINPFKASLDTLGHEPLHVFLNDLETSPHKIDNEIVQGFYKAVENSEDFKRINSDRIARGKQPFDANEIATEEAGNEFANRLLNPDKMEGKLKRSWTDLMGRIRVKWGKAGVEDYTRLLTEKFFRDPSYIERYGKGEVKTTSTQQETNKEREETYGNEISKSNEPSDSSQEGFKEGGLPTREKQVQRSGSSKEESKETSGSETKLEEPEQGLKQPSPKEVTRGISNKLGDAAIKASDEAVAASKETTFGHEEIRDDIVEELLTELDKKGLKLDTDLKQKFLVSAASDFARGDKQALDFFKAIVGDEAFDEVINNAYRYAKRYEEGNTEKIRTFRESVDKANKKAEELEAFERTDVERHSEIEQGLQPFKSIHEMPVYGHWIAPDGQVIPVKGGYGHEKIAIQELKRLLKEGKISQQTYDNLNIPLNSTTEVEDTLHRLGYLRGVRDTSKSYYANGSGHQKITKEQERALRDFGIESNLQVRYVTGDNMNTLYDPENKFSSTEQGLKTPEEILSKIKSLRKDPAFQKESTFKRGIKDVISSRIPIFGDDITKLEVRGGEEGKLIAPALREYFAKDREYEGKYLNPVAESLNKLNNDELDNLYATMLSERKQRKSLRDTLDTKSQEVYDVIRETLKQKQEEQIAANQPVQEITKEGKITYRLPRIDPFYMPEIVGSKQLDILLNAKDSQAFNNLRRDFISFQKENYDLNDTQAKKMFDDLLASYGGPVKGDTTHFGAVRRSEGFGLPESWLESSMALAMRRYWRRVAKDRAFFDSIEKDDNLLKVIGHSKNAWGNNIKPNEDLISLAGNETFGNIMDIIQGRFIKTNPRLDAFGRIASNLVLGPITGITDLINAAPILAKFIPSPANIPGFLAASMNLVEGIRAAKRTGLIRENITSLGDITNPSDEFVERLRKGADVVSKVNTREYLEKASRGLSQSLADYLVGVHLKLAEKGNQKSVNLLEGLANKQDYTKLSKEQLASRLAELGQGTYDPRGLPSWAIDSQIAPFFRLAKWNIEQLNNLHKHVIIPATKGNITPLLMTLGGGLLGGYMAKEVREQLNNKKQAMPEWKEILASKPGLKGNLPDATYNLAAAISYSGVTGLLGDLTKAGFDVAFKNTPQGFNFPLVEIVGDTAVKVNQAVSAIVDGENPIDVMTALSKDLAVNHTQIARIALNQTVGRTKNKQQVEDTESRRNLRTFKMVENKPYNAQGIQADFENPYVGLDTKRFKKRGITELPQAAKEAGELVNKAMKEGDFSTREKKLSGLKRNTFQTIPSPTSDPLGFASFIDFNTRVRGEKDTKKRLQRFFEQSNSNKIKASFVP